MKTTVRSRVRLASYPATLGWLLLFRAVDRPDTGSSLTYSHVGLAVGGVFTLLTMIATAAAVAASLEDGEFAAGWLGGLAGVILYVWFVDGMRAMNFDVIQFGDGPDPQQQAVEHIAYFAGWIGLVTGLAAVGAIVTGAAAPERPPEREKPPGRRLNSRKNIGGDLLSREVALRVPSALTGLTSLFGMGRGVSLPV